MAPAGIRLLRFGVMLGPLHAGDELFRTGWFIESLAAQALVVFAVRTRRPALRATPPSIAIAASALIVTAAAIAIPLSPLGSPLGFTAPPIAFYAALAVMVVGYLGLIEAAKRIFYRDQPTGSPPEAISRRRRLDRRAARFSSG